MAALTLASAKGAIGAALAKLAYAAGAGALFGKHVGRLSQIIHEKLLGSPQWDAVQASAADFRAAIRSAGLARAQQAIAEADAYVMHDDNPLASALAQYSTLAEGRMMDPGHNGFGAAGQEADAINRQLATLLDRVPADLARGAEVALADELVICGVLGGKDVGKSTLINALAEAQVSADASEVGRGTDRPIAYVHEAQTDAVEARLHAVGHEVDLQVCTHQADAIRNVVLLDLPDFDSEFADHLDIVRRAAPLLDRVLWVLTPKKIGDRAWVSMLHDVIKDTRNVHCVLNKTDELLSGRRTVDRA